MVISRTNTRLQTIQNDLKLLAVSSSAKSLSKYKQAWVRELKEQLGRNSRR